MTKKLPLEGRVALVTGAGRGLGRAYAYTLARNGAQVAVNSRAPESVALVVDEIERRGGRAIACAGDLEALGVPKGVVDATIEKFGRLDLVVNNAGGSEVPLTPFVATETAHRDRMMRQNFCTAWDVSAAAWPHMVAAGYGRIVMVSSPLAFYGETGFAHYAAAKAAVVGLARTLAVEGAEHGITVNVVNPIANTGGADEYSRWPRSTFSVDHVATALTWLVDERCTATGLIFAIGGSRMGRVAISETPGYLGDAQLDDPEQVSDNFEAICDDGSRLEFFRMAELLSYLDRLYGEPEAAISS